MNSPLFSTVLFQIGPVPITQAVLTTWGIMAVLVTGA
jgi:F-type H+-transporting ATPase subunit a